MFFWLLIRSTTSIDCLEMTEKFCFKDSLEQENSAPALETSKIKIPAFFLAKFLDSGNCLIPPLVEPGGFEPPTSCMPCTRSNQLSYDPTNAFREIVIQKKRMSQF